MYKDIQKIKNIQRGISLIDVLVAASLLLIVFIGISSAFRVTLELTFHNKAKATALSLANEKMELIRSFLYDDIGTIAGIPPGNIAQTENVVLNGTDYTRRVFIAYIDAPEDGIGVLDTNGVTNDYKVVKVEVSWTEGVSTKKIFIVTNFIPKGMESTVGGGTLTINVLDAVGAPIPSANVLILNNSIAPVVSVNTFTNIAGQVTLPGAPAASDYEIIVTKAGYSTAYTYGVAVLNPNPAPRHLTVVVGDTTNATFQIDLLASKTVSTFTEITSSEWFDSFNEMSGISSSASTTMIAGNLVLLKSGPLYELNGYVYSATVTPNYLRKWEEVNWGDDEVFNTDIKYKIYNATGGVLSIVSDALIPNNSIGALISPIDISGLSTTTYKSLQVAGFLSSNDGVLTPSIYHWGIKYKEGPIPLPSIAFNMRGNKTIGSDGIGNPIYKYSQNLQTDLSGSLSIPSIEWDTYTITIDNAVLGLDISSSCNPQSVSINPGAGVVTNLNFSPNTTNSLLVSVKNSLGVLLDGVTVRLYRAPFDSTQFPILCGQTFFSGLSEGTVLGFNPYSIDLSLAGYLNTTIVDIDVSGSSSIDVIINDI